MSRCRGVRWGCQKQSEFYNQKLNRSVRCWTTCEMKRKISTIQCPGRTSRCVTRRARSITMRTSCGRGSHHRSRNDKSSCSMKRMTRRWIRPSTSSRKRSRVSLATDPQANPSSRKYPAERARPWKTPWSRGSRPSWKSLPNSTKQPASCVAAQNRKRTWNLFPQPQPRSNRRRRSSYEKCSEDDNLSSRQPSQVSWTWQISSQIKTNLT